jgi:hypothetical protein
MPVRNLTPRNPPDPDWWMELDQGGTVATIGVEVTELTGDRRRLNAWRRVERSLRAIAKARSELQRIYGGVSLVAGKSPPKTKCADLAKELAKFAAAQNLERGDQLVLRNPFGTGYPAMNQFVQTLRLSSGSISLWRCADLTAGWAGISLPAVRGAIEGKARKDYHISGLKELWLLVVLGAEVEDVHDGSRPDVGGDMRETLKRLDVSAEPFNKVFLIDMGWNWAYQVRPRVLRLAGNSRASDAQSGHAGSQPECTSTKSQSK